VRFFLSLLLALSQAACLKQIALSSVADAMSSTGSTFSSDDDPELVADAVPFALKTMESLMPELPDHAPLRLAACSGFTQYGFAFVLHPAKLQDDVNVERAAARRAKKLFLRARDYCIESLEIRHKGFAKAVTEDKASLTKDSEILSRLGKDDVPALYWLSASTALSISALKEQVDQVPNLPVVDVLIRRALELDADWDKGTLWEFLIAFDGGRSEGMGGSAKRAREAYEKAVQLSENKRAGPHVSLAESVSVNEQNRKEFDVLLDKALAVDLDAAPENRLANVLSQRRAKRLKATADDLILGDE
jgi:predicted anti-sigma-YlaC factor YlaD